MCKKLWKYTQHASVAKQEPLKLHVQHTQMTLLHCRQLTRNNPFLEAFSVVFTSCWHAILAPVDIVGMSPCCIEHLANFLGEFCGEIGETTGI